MKNFLFTTLVLFSLSASALLAEDAKCPISGKPVDPSVTSNVNGKSVAFCCEKCQAKFEKQLGVKDDGPGKCPISGKEAVKDTRLIQVTAEAVYTCCEKCAKKYMAKNNITIKDDGPGKCPISGKPASADHFVVHNGTKVYFCCENCPKKYVKNNNIQIVDKGPAKCPVSGEDADPDTRFFQTTAKAVYFCCEKCQAKYVAKQIAAK